MGVYLQELKEVFSAKKMLDLLCTALEFKDEVEFRGDQDVQAVQNLFKVVQGVVYEKTGEKIELPKKVCVLFWDYETDSLV
jgi:hypothetical protein